MSINLAKDVDTSDMLKDINNVLKGHLINTVSIE